MRINYLNVIVAFSLSVMIISCNSNKPQEGEKEEVTEEVKIKGTEVTYSTDSTTMIGYLAVNETLEGKRPGILVIHEWWGHTEYVRKRADQLAELGYTALALDMYGDGKTAEHPDDAGKYMMSVMTNLPEATARFNQALAKLKADPTVDPDKIGVIGYCFGGSLALTMANLGTDVDAIVAFHAGLGLPAMPSGNKIDAKILICNGDSDPFIPQEQETAYVDAMNANGTEFELVKYAGAQHAFTNPDADDLGKKFDLPLVYQQEADEKSWEAMKNHFSKVFGSL
uniref:dienelactone hydrolase family protein n=1 Tax=Fulvivirga sp. TaxID=1931237 RepID=UPI00404B54C0